jgi:hypothetical protein
MPNPFIPRAQVHEWSERIGDDPTNHQTSLSRLLKEQRRLSKFIEENAESMQPGTGMVANYLVGVIARMFDLAGGRLKSATWEQVREAEAKVGAAIPGLLPIGDGFTDRVRKVADRAQPHILDEAIFALFERPKKQDEPDLADAEKAKILFLVWVAIEVLDANWRPPSTFSGESSYTFAPVTA